MALISRIRTALTIVLVVLSVALVAAIVLGVLIRPLRPLSYPTVEGRIIAHARGNHSLVGRALHLPSHQVGITVSCQGSGHIDVFIGTVGSTQNDCRNATVTSAAYVLSTLPGTTYTWRVQSHGSTRWAVVFTDPLDEGGGASTP